MKIADVNVPEPLLNALRDGKLVVFAGAGVSMGPPAGLPDFRRLAEQVAEGTGQYIGERETEDRFLGRLRDSGVDVRRRAVDVLQRTGTEPTKLHYNLLRLYSKPEDIRIATTNFDVLFEQAVINQPGRELKIYTAPSLPFGSRFRGLVHIHGSVDEPEEMILTDQDFGHAYLTESDGWARRFLVELFGNYVVLFVGYSHSDTIMTYLTPSLPRTDSDLRFSLVGALSEERDRWQRMGITPIVFEQEHSNDFSGLDGFLDGLAIHMSRRILDWRREITAIASRPPPIDEEPAGIIEHALTTLGHTRFFVEAAGFPEWIAWLDMRGLLDALFADGDLNEKEAMLSQWLAHRFAVRHPGELFSTIERHGGRLNADLWDRLARRLGRIEEEPADSKTLSRWVHFLLSAAPTLVDDSVLSGLAVACAGVGDSENLLQVYDAMTANRFQTRPGAPRRFAEGRGYRIQQLWDRCLEPNLPEIGRSLLDRTVIRLQGRRSLARAWGLAGEGRDHDSSGRSTIEPDSQDRIPSEIDASVNIARGCLEYLSANDPVFVAVWSQRFACAEVPLLRRLAVHAMSARADLSGDEKIAWLLDHCNVNDIPAHHEISRAAALAFPDAGPQARIRLVQAVLGYGAQYPEDVGRETNVANAYHSLKWFRRLHEADPECSIVRNALDDVLGRHSDLAAVEDHEVILGRRRLWAKGPWTAEELLTRPVSEWLTDLVNYQPTERERVEGYHRGAMLEAVSAAVGIDQAWGLDLADVMAVQEVWVTDLWHHVITSWDPEKMNGDELNRMLAHVSEGKLHRQNASEITWLLEKLVRLGAETGVAALQPQADSIALALQPYAAVEVTNSIGSIGSVPNDLGWLNEAADHLSGQLALYWIFSIELWRNQQEIPPPSLSVQYRTVLNAICGDDSVSGKLGRTVLASQFHFLFALDEQWTLDNLLPIFHVDHEDFQCAWDGFLNWGYLSPAIAEHLKEAFQGAYRRINEEFSETGRIHFLELYVAMMEWFITGANDKWITEVFQHADAETKRLFAAEICHCLRELDESEQQEWWNLWLRDYWGNRIDGIPSSLDEDEISWMLQWALELPGVFEGAVKMATQMTPAPIANSSLLYGLSQSTLVDRYPEELAKFLLHLGRCDVGPGFWYGTRALVDRLREGGLPSDLDLGLQELEALHVLGP